MKEKYRKPILIDDYRECKEPDTSGNYMNRVLDELKDRGYAISGYNFGGNGFYIVTVVKPTGRIGSSEVKVLVNEFLMQNSIDLLVGFFDGMVLV